MLIYFLLLDKANDRMTAERGRRREEGITTGNKPDTEFVSDYAVYSGIRRNSQHTLGGRIR